MLDKKPAQRRLSRGRQNHTVQTHREGRLRRLDTPPHRRRLRGPTEERGSARHRCGGRADAAPAKLDEVAPAGIAWSASSWSLPRSWTSATWRARLGELEAQVCRVEVPARDRPTAGTGFLVGPDLVLTKYHVIEVLQRRWRTRKRPGCASTTGRRPRGPRSRREPCSGSQMTGSSPGVRRARWMT